MYILRLPWDLFMAFLTSKHAFWRVVTICVAILGSVLVNGYTDRQQLLTQLDRQDARKVEMIADAKAVVIAKGDDIETDILREFCAFDAGLCDVVKAHTSFRG